ncbi:pilus assembly protein TadG-related protein [Myceligenerans crystallogenes]|uniref:Putative Flp pilus-assembly TadG-like N-terminal domain-containing protein n=1 Tax=Myceligenerans crystallogenes TaxID=316335 RepID=A0ABN2NL85_9MICO
MNHPGTRPPQRRVLARFPKTAPSTTRTVDQHRHDEKGSVTPWFVVTAIGLIAIVGLVLDGGDVLHTQQRAYGIAAQAARTGGQQLDVAAVVSGGEFAVEPNTAIAAAHEYLDAAGVKGTVTIAADQIHVTVREDCTPQILGAFGLGPFPIEVTASARLVRVIGGTEG